MAKTTKTDINKVSRKDRLFGHQSLYAKKGSPATRKANRKKKVRDVYDREMTRVSQDFYDENITQEKAKARKDKIKKARDVAMSQADSEFKREQIAFGKQKYGTGSTKVVKKAGGKTIKGYNKGGPGKFRSELDGVMDGTGRSGYMGGRALHFKKNKNRG